MTLLNSIAIRRLGLLPLNRGAGASQKHTLIVQSELAKLGMRIVNAKLFAAADQTLFSDYQGVMAQLASVRGGDVSYVPLFLGFPDEVPDDDAYFAKRVIGYLGNVYELFEGAPALESGMHIPEWLFSIEKFGADPISQFQNTSQWKAAEAKLEVREDDSHTEWMDVELVFVDEVEARLEAWMQSCLYAKSSIKEALHDDLKELLAFLGTDAIDMEKISIKENKALVLRLLWQLGRYEAVVQAASTPTDVLRMFAAITASDISLSSGVTFPKLSRKQRRLVLAVLESCSDLQEDLQRYRGLWLALGRGLHPGEYKRAYPKAFEAFAALRADRIQTFASKTEELLIRVEPTEVLTHLSSRPGVLARKVHELLRVFPSRTEDVLGAFAKVAAKLTVKNLLVLTSYFETINELEYRTVINKKGTIKVLPNNAKEALSAKTLQAIAGVLEDALLATLGSRDSWQGQGVWIDPALAAYTVPLAQRAASDGTLSIGRGSRIPVTFDKVLRLFVYWKQAMLDTDLDLSVTQYDADFNYAGHVSYTNLSESGIAHSGDLQSAPHGAAEFIDITLDKIANSVRYLAVQVHRYAGDAFAEMDCHAGWMVRKEVNADYKSFDVATVANKFDLHGRAGYCVPLIVDLHAKEIIMTDLYVGTRTAENQVEGVCGEVAIMSKEIARFTKTRPTLKTLAEYHVQARGASLTSKAHADIRFGIENCTYNATQVETILAELL